MAIDFDGANSKLEHTTADLLITTDFSIVASVFADGQGEGNAGRILSLPESGARSVLGHNNSANTLFFIASWNTSGGTWTFPAPDGQWNTIAISYSASSTVNDPVVRVNNNLVTVTRTVAPVGTWTAPATGYCIGNNSGQAATWDGGIEHMRVFNVVLTLDEMSREFSKQGSVTRGRKLWLGMETVADVTDRSGNGLDGVATALTLRTPGPTITMPPGSRRLMVQHRNPDTTVGEVNATLVDKSRLIGPNGKEPSRLVIERIQWVIFGGGTLTLSFDHTSDDIVAVLSEPGNGDRIYPNGGLVDPASAGGTGDLLLSASNVAGGSYKITIILRMKD